MLVGVGQSRARRGLDLQVLSLPSLLAARRRSPAANGRPSWQNSMATNWPQQVKPRAWRSARVCLTRAWNSVRGNTGEFLHGWASFVWRVDLRLNGHILVQAKGRVAVLGETDSKLSWYVRNTIFPARSGCALQCRSRNRYVDTRKRFAKAVVNLTGCSCSRPARRRYRKYDGREGNHHWDPPRTPETDRLHTFLRKDSSGNYQSSS